MVKGFDKYIREGKVTIGRNASDHLFQPDHIRPRTNIITTSRGSAVPRHWSNSPAMSGGTGINLGANPKSKDKKNKVLTYKDFIGKSNSFSNRKK